MENRSILGFWACIILSSIAMYANDALASIVWFSGALVFWLLQMKSSNSKNDVDSTMSKA